MQILVYIGSVVKNLPVIQETQVRSLGWEDPVEKEMATHSSILAWRIPWTEEPSGLQSIRSQWDMTKATQQARTDFQWHIWWLVRFVIQARARWLQTSGDGHGLSAEPSNRYRAQADQGSAAGKSMEEKDPG